MEYFLRKQGIDFEKTLYAKWVVDSDTGERYLIDLSDGLVICSEKEMLSFSQKQ